MFDFSDEQKMVGQLIRRWATEKLQPAVPAMERGETLPYDLMRDFVRTFGIGELARARIEKQIARAEAPSDTSAKADASEGGKGGMDEGGLAAVLSIELSRVCPGFILAFGASAGLAGGAILAKGTAAQKRKYGIPIATYEKIGAWGMTEPGAGSDAFGSMRTVARRKGDGFVLSGQKTFITNAPFADTFVIYAKIADGAEDLRGRPIHAFILEKGMPGLSLGRPMEKMGMHSSPTGEIFLEDVEVPREQLLGGVEKDPSREQARDVFHSERTGMAPMCYGILDRCLEVAIAYARERETWGQKIGEYQLVQEKLARMFMHRENVKNLMFKQLWYGRSGKKMPMAEACAVKLYCARVTTECAMEAVQLLGGNGYMREYAVEMMARDAKLLQIGGGTDEIQIVTIARHLLKD